MKKRALSLLLVLLLLGAAGHAAGAAGGMEGFEPGRSYAPGTFADVDEEQWFSYYAALTYEYGLIDGRDGRQFDPGGTLTAAEAVKLAAVIHSVYHTGAADFGQASPWYVPYAQYALANGILDAAPDYSAAVTRAGFAAMIYAALPAAEFPQKNDIAPYEVFDVTPADGYCDAVYGLYRAGVLTGSDGYGAFLPETSLPRAEACAVISRVISPQLRKTVALPAALDAAYLYEYCIPAVFRLERYDADGEPLGIGSGFFIGADGYAVTNYHVLEGAVSASVTLYDGTVLPVEGVCGYDALRDIAVIKIGGGGYRYLKTADPAGVREGMTVYSLGSPLGLMSSISEGVVSGGQREVDGAPRLQYTSSLAVGSGGGPIINAKGQVVGITSGFMPDGQSLNLGVPASAIGEVREAPMLPLAEVFATEAEEE